MGRRAKVKRMILNALSYRDTEVVKIGAAYRRRGTGAVVEIAYVTEVANDKMGIPHVRYQLQVARGSGMPTVENRTLALEVFQTRYRERLTEDGDTAQGTR